MCGRLRVSDEPSSVCAGTGHGFVCCPVKGWLVCSCTIVLTDAQHQWLARNENEWICYYVSAAL